MCASIWGNGSVCSLQQKLESAPPGYEVSIFDHLALVCEILPVKKIHKKPMHF